MLTTKIRVIILLHDCAVPAGSHISTTLSPTHKYVICLIIDFLRFDILSLHPLQLYSVSHHNISTLP